MRSIAMDLRTVLVRVLAARPLICRLLHRRPRDGGNASVIVLGVIGVLVSVTGGALVLAGVVRASHQARMGADLAAIAGALQVGDGASASFACAAAARIATANGTSLQACSVSGSEVRVIAAATSATWPEPATAQARAGPEGTGR